MGCWDVTRRDKQSVRHQESGRAETTWSADCWGSSVEAEPAGRLLFAAAKSWSKPYSGCFIPGVVAIFTPRNLTAGSYTCRPVCWLSFSWLSMGWQADTQSHALPVSCPVIVAAGTEGVAHCSSANPANSMFTLVPPSRRDLHELKHRSANMIP